MNLVLTHFCFSSWRHSLTFLVQSRPSYKTTSAVLPGQHLPMAHRADRNSFMCDFIDFSNRRRHMCRLQLNANNRCFLWNTTPHVHWSTKGEITKGEGSACQPLPGCMQCPLFSLRGRWFPDSSGGRAPVANQLICGGFKVAASCFSLLDCCSAAERYQTNCCWKFPVGFECFFNSFSSSLRSPHSW